MTQITINGVKIDFVTEKNLHKLGKEIVEYKHTYGSSQRILRFKYATVENNGDGDGRRLLVQGNMCRYIFSKQFRNALHILTATMEIVFQICNNSLLE